MKKPRIKTEQLVLIVIFLAVIAVPAMLLFQNSGRYLTGENRMAASFPKLIKDDGSLSTRTDFENFFDDNIGFRSAAPLLNAQVMYKLFGTILDTAQLKGKDGNLFAGDDRRFPTRRAPYPPLTERELADNGQNIEAASDYFKTKDIPFLFITIPDKEEVYPNLYPDTFLQKPDQDRLAQQTYWLNANTDVDAFDMTNYLRQTAENFNGMLWYETGNSAHWNYMGAWYGYLAIMDRLKKYDPGVKVLNLDEFNVTTATEPYTNVDGSLVYSGMYNTVYTFDYKPGFSSTQITNGEDPWMPQDQLDLAGFQKGGVYYHFHNDNEKGQLVFFGDSYVYQFLLPYFAESFGDVYLFFLPTNYQIMKPVLDMIGADYVVLEMVERTYGSTNMNTMADEFAADAPTLTRPADYPEIN